LGAFAILAGAVLLSWQGEVFRLDSGAPLVAGACLAWGLDNNFTRKISAADPVSIAMIKGLVAGTANLGLALFAGFLVPTTGTTIAAGFIGFFGIGVSLVMFIFALRHLGTARTGAYYSTAPFIGAALAVVFLGESVTATLALAAFLMAVGVWLHLSERHEHEHSHVHDKHHQHSHDGPVTEPHSHWHRHEPMRHKHPHYPDLHHRHHHG
jgi:drug/metabolite transporter (DMT)-like permease